jgi:hypothetical protein
MELATGKDLQIDRTMGDYYLLSVLATSQMFLVWF